MRYDFRPSFASRFACRSPAATGLMPSFARTPAGIGSHAPGRCWPVVLSGIPFPETFGSPKSPGNPCACDLRRRLPPTPCSSTPVESFRLTFSPVRCGPRTLKRQGLPMRSISGLYHTARCSLCTLRAVVTFDYATLASGGWLAFAGSAFAEWVSTDQFHLSFPINSSFPELRLARSRRDPSTFLPLCDRDGTPVFRNVILYS